MVRRSPPGLAVYPGCTRPICSCSPLSQRRDWQGPAELLNLPRSTANSSLACASVVQGGVAAGDTGGTALVGHRAGLQPAEWAAWGRAGPACCCPLHRPGRKSVPGHAASVGDSRVWLRVGCEEPAARRISGFRTLLRGQTSRVRRTRRSSFCGLCGARCREALVWPQEKAALVTRGWDGVAWTRQSPWQDAGVFEHASSPRGQKLRLLCFTGFLDGCGCRPAAVPRLRRHLGWFFVPAAVPDAVGGSAAQWHLPTPCR